MEASILNMVRSVANTRAYQPDEKVFVEGSPGNTMYVIIDGTVEITVAGRDCRTGDDRWRNGAD
jgi:CRP-like cAMP-binding protein